MIIMIVGQDSYMLTMEHQIISAFLYWTMMIIMTMMIMIMIIMMMIIMIIMMIMMIKLTIKHQIISAFLQIHSNFTLSIFFLYFAKTRMRTPLT